MVERAQTRLVEGPFCIRCNGALNIVEVKRPSEGGDITYTHRDGIALDEDHRARVTYRVLRD